jgi:hypothetical protein
MGNEILDLLQQARINQREEQGSHAARSQGRKALEADICQYAEQS